MRERYVDVILAVYELFGAGFSRACCSSKKIVDPKEIGIHIGSQDGVFYGKLYRLSRHNIN